MPKILMLTTDQTIDRRILLEADALEADGAEVRILATPGEGAADDPRVIRVAPMGDLRAGVSPELMMLRAYRWARRFVPMNGPWMTRLKSVAWRCVFSTDKVVRNLLLPSAVLQRADIVVAHDLPTLPAAAAAAERLGAELVYDSHEL